MRAKYMELLFTLAYVILFATHISSYSTSSSSANGKGVYKTYNGKKSLTAFALKKDSAEKTLFGNNKDNSRAPSHDSPSSPCKCSKYTHNCELNSTYI